MSVDDYGYYTYNLMDYDAILDERGVCKEYPPHVPNALCQPAQMGNPRFKINLDLKLCDASTSSQFLVVHPFSYEDGFYFRENWAADADVRYSYEYVHGHDILEILLYRREFFPNTVNVEMSVTLSSMFGSLLTIARQSDGTTRFDCFFNVDIRQDWREACLNHRTKDTGDSQ